MITEAKKKHNFVDALATKMRYAVLTKKSRVQVLVKPTEMQLRKRGQRGWHLYGTVESHSDADRTLDEILKKALKEIEGGASASDEPERFKPRES